MAEEAAIRKPWPPPSTAALLVHSKIRIDAPASLVYELLTSPSTWRDWNAFVPTAHLLSRKGADGKKVVYIYPSSTSDSIGAEKYRSTPPFEVGDTYRYNVQMPTSGKGSSAKRTNTTSDEVIKELTIPSETGKGAVYRATWDVVEKFGMPSASRQNEIEVLSEVECEYRSWEEMTGMMAYVVKVAVGGAVQRGFDEWSEGLKLEAEKRYKAQKA